SAGEVTLKNLIVLHSIEPMPRETITRRLHRKRTPANGRPAVAPAEQRAHRNREGKGGWLRQGHGQRPQGWHRSSKAQATQIEIAERGVTAESVAYHLNGASHMSRAR